MKHQIILMAALAAHIVEVNGKPFGGTFDRLPPVPVGPPYNKPPPIPVGPPYNKPPPVPVGPPYGVPYGDPSGKPCGGPYERPYGPPCGKPPSHGCDDGKLLTYSQLDIIKSYLREIVTDPNTARAPEINIASTVRLSFHDCVGGCDGCIDLDNPDNGGSIRLILPLLDDLYVTESLQIFLSKADFYALAGIVAIEEGIANANEGRDPCNQLKVPDIPFKYCREDAICSTLPQRTFPDGHLDHQGVMDFFRQQFDFDERLSTAIMGGHTLGGARPSGWQGIWKENLTEGVKFDERYFTLMSDPAISWIHIDKSLENNFPDERWQWEGFKNDTKAAFMLNADVALYRDIDPMPFESTCGLNAPQPICNFAPTANLVVTYAHNAHEFIKDFGKAFTKMINTAHGNLKYPAPY